MISAYEINYWSDVLNLSYNWEGGRVQLDMDQIGPKQKDDFFSTALKLVFRIHHQEGSRKS
jgi:hypothetical protein